MTEIEVAKPRSGVAFVGGAASLIAAATWLLSAGQREHLAASAIAVGMLAAAAVAALCLRGGRGVIAYPLIVFAGLGSIGAIDSSLGTAFSGLLTLAFIYLGLYGSRRTVILALAPAIGAWMLANGVVGDELTRAAAVRLPIAVVIWASVGILLSEHTQRVNQQASSLQDQAFRDPLTSLHNRRALAELSKAASPGDALVLLDIDHFKGVNDEHGHLAGDTVLVEFAALLQDSLRSRDNAIRYGGEEFLLYLPDTTTAQVRIILDRIRARWAATSPVVTFSAGAATVSAGRGIIEAMGLADRRLYAAKEGGRNRSVIDDAPPREGRSEHVPAARQSAAEALRA
jgi:diguanylate cyclase (GGDEF)-like protein